MELATQNGEHVHSRVGLALKQDRDIMTVYLNADRFLLSRSHGLMRRLLQHRCEAEEFSGRRLIDHHFLMVFINCGEPDRPRNHHVSLATRVANLVDPLAWREGFHFNLTGKNGALFIIEQGEEWHLSQNGGIAGHWRPPTGKNA